MCAYGQLINLLPKLVMRPLSRVSYASTFSVINNASFLGSLDLVGECLPKERFVSGATDEMVCLTCNLVSTDPVYMLCCPKRFYCYKCLVGERKDCPTIVCPSCQIPINARAVTRNDSMRNAVFSLKTVTCDYFNAGCSVLSTVETISDHVEGCEYQPSPCINRGCTEICLLKDWEWHYRVKCPKRQIRCHGSCHSYIYADEIDYHDCDHVVEDFREYQNEEIILMYHLFHDDDQSNLGSRFQNWHDQQQNDKLAITMEALRHKLMLLNEDDEVHDSLGHVIHHGRWRCSSLKCDLPFEKHDYSKTFPDNKHHIFFWDCCLNDCPDSTTCDMA